MRYSGRSNHPIYQKAKCSREVLVPIGAKCRRSKAGVFFKVCM